MNHTFKECDSYEVSLTTQAKLGFSVLTSIVV